MYLIPKWCDCGRNIYCHCAFVDVISWLKMYVIGIASFLRCLLISNCVHAHFAGYFCYLIGLCKVVDHQWYVFRLIVWKRKWSKRYKRRRRQEELFVNVILLLQVTWYYDIKCDGWFESAGPTEVGGSKFFLVLPERILIPFIVQMAQLIK